MNAQLHTYKVALEEVYRQKQTATELRHRVAQLTLPVDLTAAEADHITDFVQTLASEQERIPGAIDQPHPAECWCYGTGWRNDLNACCTYGPRPVEVVTP